MKEPKKKATPETSRCDVLIVDDDESTRHMVGVIVRHRIPNIRIQSAEDGLEGLKKVKAFRPRILWTGVKMPRMDGLELIELIRQDPVLQNIKIILCTGCYTMEDVKTRARELGVDKLLPKPFKVEEALSVIVEWLGS
jgi:CheY-like chemotaxis protein